MATLAPRAIASWDASFQIALAHRLGVPKALGLSTEEWVRERLGGYARLEIEPRREAVLELTADGFTNDDVDR
jgi:hypothetical protein